MGPPRVFNKRGFEPIPPSAVYVGRPTLWGNPIRLTSEYGRAKVLYEYMAWLRDQSQLLGAIPTLFGCDLVCWCAPAACHADVLLALANPAIVGGYADFRLACDEWLYSDHAYCNADPCDWCLLQRVYRRVADAAQGAV